MPDATVLHLDPAMSAAPDPDWPQLADEIDRLNRTEPRVGLERATAWVERERGRASREGELRALRAQAHALRFLGQYDRAIAQYEHVEAQFREIGLDAEAARTEVGHVTALRYKGRYQEAADLAVQTRAFFLRRGDQLQAAGVGRNVKELRVPNSGTLMANGASVFRSAPHPRATRVFLNWLWSREGQFAWSRAAQLNSRRTDVPPFDANTFPDYAQLDRYALLGTQQGAALFNRVPALYQSLR